MTSTTPVIATTVTTPCNITGIIAKESKAGDLYFQLICEQEIKRSNQPSSLLAKFNIGDPRFNQSKARKIWIKATPPAIELYTGIKPEQLEKLEKDQTLVVLVEDLHVDGNKVNIQVQEFTESEINSALDSASEKQAPAFEYLLENKEKTAKHLPDTQEYFITKDSQELVFMISTLVEGTANHRFLEVEKVAKDEVFVPSKTSKSTSRQPELNPFKTVK